MKDVFLPNCRIEKNEDGIRFYEQDILCCNYIFTGDLKINMTVDILSSGFGVALFKDNSKTALEANEAIIFKFGSLDFSVINKSYTAYSTPVHSSCSIAPPMQNAKITFIKSGAKIQLYHNDIKAGEYTMKNPYDTYRIGFYSNSGNIIRYINIYAGVPKKWDVSVKNTNGGRIKFFLNGFTVENCEHDLEVEQDRINLSKGNYVLDYDNSIDSDIKSFLFFYDNEEVYDEKKSIVRVKDGTFTIKKDGLVDLKFRGQEGTVKNVCIKDDTRSSYVETEDIPITLDGSWIKINLSGLSKIDMTGIVYNIPDQTDLTKKSNYSLIETSSSNYKIGDLNVELNREYDYSIDVKKLKLYVSNQEKQIIMNDKDMNIVTVFNNINGKITKLILTDTDGNEINVLIQKTYKFYLPASISGPIIVTDENESPLEISSSYRMVDDNYVFTNWERELFKSSEIIKLTNTPINEPGSFVIYGVADFDENKIYNVQNLNSINSIDLCSSKYTIIDSYSYNEDANIIDIDESIKSKFRYFIIDYLKKDNYCINYIESLNNYEVDISTKIEVLYIIHEKDTSNGYILTDINTLNNKYIALRKGV